MGYTNYQGKNMSERAASAYKDGLKPAKEWKKAELLAGITDAEVLKRLKAMKIAEIRQIRLEKKEWHHTTKSFTVTNFYELCPAEYVRGELFRFDFPQVVDAVDGYAANDNSDVFVEGVVKACHEMYDGSYRLILAAGGEYDTWVDDCKTPRRVGEKVTIKVAQDWRGNLRES